MPTWSPLTNNKSQNR